MANDWRVQFGEDLHEFIYITDLYNDDYIERDKFAMCCAISHMNFNQLHSVRFL